MSWGQTWDGVYSRASVCCGWTRQAQHGQWTRLIQAVEGETEAGLVGEQQGQPAQPGPCTDPPSPAEGSAFSLYPLCLSPQPPSAPQAAGTGRAGSRDAVPPSPRAPRLQEPPLTSKDGAGGSGQRHRREQELAQGWEGAEHPGSPRLQPPGHSCTPTHGDRVLPPASSSRCTDPGAQYPTVLRGQEARVKFV